LLGKESGIRMVKKEVNMIYILDSGNLHPTLGHESFASCNGKKKIKEL
jgi:hypothetical protein